MEGKLVSFLFLLIILLDLFYLHSIVITVLDIAIFLLVAFLTGYSPGSASKIKLKSKD